jgi:hypothetical protein
MESILSDLMDLHKVFQEVSQGLLIAVLKSFCEMRAGDFGG